MDQIQELRTVSKLIVPCINSAGLFDFSCGSQALWNTIILPFPHYYLPLPLLPFPFAYFTLKKVTSRRELYLITLLDH